MQTIDSSLSYIDKFLKNMMLNIIKNYEQKRHQNHTLAFIKQISPPSGN